MFLAVGLKAQEYIKTGSLVPDNIMIEFITNELAKIPNQSWLLDGNEI